MSTNFALRLAASVYTALAQVIAATDRRLSNAREQGDRGDNNISTIMWIVGIVAFAAVAIAAFKTLGQSKLDDMKGL